MVLIHKVGVELGAGGIIFKVGVEIILALFMFNISFFLNKNIYLTQKTAETRIGKLIIDCLHKRIDLIFSVEVSLPQNFVETCGAII